ncbi:uncharacterized protein LOC141912270 [Tubulanus polymorphus]|uniref:uncharacterized protein LOC141912270 n=1 Tax=Tubulanus polymorphus TaxID=672921 RepID=UPI003DA2E6DB
MGFDKKVLIPDTPEAWGPVQSPPVTRKPSQKTPVTETDTGNSCMSTDPVKYYKAHTAMGSIQIIIGILAIVLGGYLASRGGYACYGGIAGGASILFILGGAFGIAGREKKRCFLITCLVFCIIAAVTCGLILVTSAAIYRQQNMNYRADYDGIKKSGDLWDDWKDRHDHSSTTTATPTGSTTQDSSSTMHDRDDRKNKDRDHGDWKKRRWPGRSAIAVHCVLGFFLLFEMVVAIVQAAYCCQVTCCRSRVSQEPIIVVMSGQPPAYQGQGQQRPNAKPEKTDSASEEGVRKSPSPPPASPPPAYSLENLKRDDSPIPEPEVVVDSGETRKESFSFGQSAFEG